MNIDLLLSRIKDTGIETNTLISVMNQMLNYGYVDVRHLSLEGDKKVNYSDGYNDNEFLIKSEIIIYKKIIKTLKSQINNEVYLSKLGITKEQILNLLRLSDEDIKDFCTSKPPTPNTLEFIILKMAKLNDYSGSHQIDLFEEKKQTSVRNKTQVDYTKRIYLNMPLNKIGTEFLTLFKLKCIENGVPSKMKGFGASAGYTGELDTTIIYSNDYYLLKHIEILEEIIKTRPDLISKFGTPVISGARFTSSDNNCYYTISAGLYPNGTSNDFYDGLYKRAFALLCAKYFNNTTLDDNSLLTYKDMKISNINKINSEYHTIIRKKIENGELNFSELINEYREIIKQLSSMLKYNDSIHSEVPIYQDDIFNQFVNKNTNNKEANITDNNEEKNIYLYHTEELINEILELYEAGDISFDKLISNYLARMNLVYKTFKHYALREPAFVSSERYQTVINIFNQLPIKEYEKEKDATPIDKLEYYQQVQEQINNYLNNTKNHTR